MYDMYEEDTTDVEVGLADKSKDTEIHVMSTGFHR